MCSCWLAPGTGACKAAGMCTMGHAERLDWQRPAGVQVERKEEGRGGQYPPPLPVPTHWRAVWPVGGGNCDPKQISCMMCYATLLCARGKAYQNDSASWTLPPSPCIHWGKLTSPVLFSPTPLVSALPSPPPHPQNKVQLRLLGSFLLSMHGTFSWALSSFSTCLLLQDWQTKVGFCKQIK